MTISIGPTRSPWLTLMAGRWGFTLEAGRRVIAAVTPDCMTIGPKTFPR